LTFGFQDTQPQPKPKVDTKICYKLDDGTTVCQ